MSGWTAIGHSLCSKHDSAVLKSIYQGVDQISTDHCSLGATTHLKAHPTP